MYCFRVYTEDINRKLLLKEANKRFPSGYTLFEAQGHWNGTSEKSVIIEIIETWDAEPAVKRFIADIKRISKQDTVYVTSVKLDNVELV